jgi:hypothetical protein
MTTIDAKQDRVWVTDGPAPEVHIHHHYDAPAFACPAGMVCSDTPIRPVEHGYSGGLIVVAFVLGVIIGIGLSSLFKWLEQREMQKLEDLRRSARCCDKPYQENA